MAETGMPIETASLKERERERRLRALGKERRSALSVRQRREKSVAIQERLMGTDAWKRASCLLVYAAFGSEVETGLLIGRALEEGKRVFCPRVEGAEMEFFQIRSPLDLRPGYRGIPEPAAGGQAYGGWEQEKALLAAPGTVFDRRGRRIGYGGGYYDRYLSRLGPRRPACAGLGFSCQLVERIVAKPTDIPMDFVVTESGILLGSGPRAGI